MLDLNELKKLAEKVDGILSPEEKRMMGLVPSNDAEALERRVKSLVEEDLAQSVTLTPLVRMVDKKTLYPWQGKESDAEIAFSFESIMDAQDLYDFIVNMGLLEPGEIKLKMIEGQVSVHFASHVLVTKPEVIQAAMLAYYEGLDESSEEAFHALAEDIAEVITERIKVSGAPKGRAKGNPFHDKDTGKFSGGGSIAGKDGGSFAVGKTKLKFAKAKKSKAGDTVVHFASTKHPCGRAARKAGKDIRCWDGKKGMGIRIAAVMKKRIRNEHISDDELKAMLEAIDYINGMANLVVEELGESCGLPHKKKRSKGKGKGLGKEDSKAPMGGPAEENTSLEEGRKYHVLIGKASASDPWEIAFGDYDKDVVKDEMEDVRGDWRKLKIITVGSDDQKSIDAAVAKLNEGVEMDEAGSGFGKTFKPDEEMIAALKRWREEHGKDWKKKLMMAWQRSGYGHGFDDISHLLQQMRNKGGPSWLDKYDLAEDVVMEEARLDISPYVNNHGAKPRGKGEALWMFGFDDKYPTNDKIFQFTGKLAKATKAALKAGNAAGATVVYLLP